VGSFDVDRAADRQVHRLLEVREKDGRGVGKRVTFERRQGDGRYGVQVTPQERLAQEKDVSSRKKNGLVGGAGAGNVAAGDAPVVAVKVGDGHVQNLQRAQDRGVHGLEKATQVTQLGRFPVKTLPDVEGVNG